MAGRAEFEHDLIRDRGRGHQTLACMPSTRLASCPMGVGQPDVIFRRHHVGALPNGMRLPRRNTQKRRSIANTGYNRVRFLKTPCADPVSRNFQAASEAIGVKGKINRAAKLKRNNIANDACAIARSLWPHNIRAAHLLPINDKTRRSPIALPLPPEVYASVGIG